MLGWAEIGFLSSAAVLLACGTVPRLRASRSLFWAGGVLMLISAVFPRHGNPLGQYLFVGPLGAQRVPELFEIAWWILGAWILKSLLDLVLRLIWLIILGGLGLLALVLMFLYAGRLPLSRRPIVYN